MKTIPLQELKDWFHSLPQDHEFARSSLNSNECGCILTQFGRFKGKVFTNATGNSLVDYNNIDDGEIELFHTSAEGVYLSDQIGKFVSLFGFWAPLSSPSQDTTLTKGCILRHHPDFLK